MSPVQFCHVPAGKVLLEAQDAGGVPASVSVPAFAIARTPITNAQFNVFHQAGGYHEGHFWSDEGWAARLRYRWDEPRYRSDPSWNGADRPVVGVSYYEAEAFCRFLSQQQEMTCLLPTESQWQRAAQGDDHREYPWGDDPPADYLCNWARSEDQTTPVDRYELGASPYGVLDLSGNVWEWTRDVWLSDSAMSSERRQFRLRGGCWSSDSPISLRAANRLARDPGTRQPPHFRDAIVGFRVVSESFCGR